MRFTREGTQDQEAILQELLTRCVEALESGSHEQVEELCAANPAFAQRIREHLKALEDSGLLDAEPHEEELPAAIGPYHIIEKLGQGGMGAVYLAQQQEPFERRVALKMIKLGMDSREIVARFEAERQALAMMSHASIAAVYDAAVTEQGRPYFAMEYVPGIPIHQYCDQQHLSTEERLELFLLICDAVQHAHQKGIIHRDLKPANVLVMKEGAKAVPKIIDFGVAKAIRQRLTVETLCTEQGQILGTPEYMSPEQARGEGLDIDTRTDIYSLGVMLYEVLSGMLPFEPKELRRAGFAQMRRILCEEDPPTPSRRISTLGMAAQPMAEARMTDPRGLVRHLRGDLDWIVLKALEKDRNRRYATALELSADIYRHLKHEPVLAARPSRLYRLGKLVRRHREATAGLLVVFVALVAGLISTTVMYSLAKRNEATAQQSFEVLEDILASVDPALAQGHEVTVKEVLANAPDTLNGRYPERVEAAVLAAVGRVQTKLGNYEEGKQPLEKALRIRRRLLGDTHPDTIRTMIDLARLHRWAERYPPAAKLYEEALPAFGDLEGPDHPQVLRSWIEYVSMPLRVAPRDQLDQTLPYFESLVKQLGRDHPIVLDARQLLVGIHWDLGNVLEALELTEETLELQGRQYGEGHPRVVRTRHMLSLLYHARGETEEAVSHAEEAWEKAQKILGEDHMDALNYGHSLARALVEAGELERAEKLVRDIHEKQAIVLKTRPNHEHSNTLRSLVTLAKAHLAQGELDEAQRVARDAYERLELSFPSGLTDTVECLSTLGRIHLARGEVTAAEKLFRQSLDENQRPPDNWRALRLRVRFARCLIAMGEERFQEAEDHLRASLAGFVTHLGADAPRTLEAARELMSLYDVWGRADEAAELRGLHGL